jgi:hypothetical protein
MGVQALINVFKDFKPVADAIEDVVNGIKDAFGALINGGSMQEAIRVGNQLAETYRDLEDTAGGYNIQVSKTKGQIDRLVISAKDLGKTEEERKKLLEQAGDLEKKLFDESLKRNSEKLISERNNLLEKTKLTKRELDLLATGADADNEDFQRIKDKFENVKGLDAELLTNYQKTLLERQDLQNDSNKFQEKIVNAENKLIEKQQAQAEKAEAERKRIAEQKKKDDEKALADSIKAAKDEEDRLNKIADRNASLEELRINTLLTGQQQEEALFELAFEKRIEGLRALNLS